MKLSIVTVVRNDRAGLERTLDSTLRAQTGFSDWEQIVVDGASTDGTFGALEPYRGHPRLGFCVSEPDGGIYSAMNKGAARANGKYLLFLNAGDSLLPDVLERTFGCPHGAELVYGDSIHVSRSNERFMPSAPPEKLAPGYFLRSTLPHQATFISKRLHEVLGGYDESFRIAGDADFFLRAFIEAKPTVEKLPFVVCRFDMGGVSSSDATREESLRERERFLTPFFGPEAAHEAVYPKGTCPFVRQVVLDAARNDPALTSFLLHSVNGLFGLWRRVRPLRWLYTAIRRSR